MVETLTRGRHRFLMAVLLSWPSLAAAHRLDECLQATLVDLEPGRVRLEINLTPGAAIAEQVLSLIDGDHDGVISDREAAGYSEVLRRDLIIELDEARPELNLIASHFPEPAELRSGAGIIRMEFSAATGEIRAGTHRLSLENRHLPGLSVYLFNALLPESPLIRITDQVRSENQSVGSIAFSAQFPASPAKSASTGLRLPALGVLLILAAVFTGWIRLRRRRAGLAQQISS